MALYLLSKHSHPDMPSSPLAIGCSHLHTRARQYDGFDAKPPPPGDSLSASDIQLELWGWSVSLGTCTRAHKHTCTHARVTACSLTIFRSNSLPCCPRRGAQVKVLSSQTCRAVIFFGKILKDVPFSLLHVSGRSPSPSLNP